MRKGILLFVGLYEGSLILVSPHVREQSVQRNNRDSTDLEVEIVKLF